MRWRWAYLFENTATFSMDDLVSDIESAGITLANPDSGRITRLTADGLPLAPTNPDSGNQISSSQAELASLVNSGHDVPFQWWLDSGRDIFCSIHRISAETLAELYDLGGLSTEEVVRLFEALLAHFLTGVESGSSQGLIFDPKGVNEDFDWKEYFLNPSDRPRSLPEFALLPSTLADRFKIYPDIHLIEHLGPYTLVTERNSPLLNARRRVAGP